MEAAAPAAASGRVESAPILVVDDESSARELLVTYLNSEGFHTATARNGDEAVRKARQMQPDAITLDLVMHGKSGWETLNQLKKDPATAAIPVVVVSVLDEKQAGFSLGAAEYPGQASIQTQSTGGARPPCTLARRGRSPRAGGG